MNLKTITLGTLILSYGADAGQQVREERVPPPRLEMFIEVKENLSNPGFHLPPPLSFQERFGYKLGSDEWRRQHYYKGRGTFVGFWNAEPYAKKRSEPKTIPQESSVIAIAIDTIDTQLRKTYKCPYSVEE